MNRDQKRTFKDIYNYWKTLKDMGITEKELIMKMNSFFDNVMLDIYPSQDFINCPCQEHHKHNCYFGKRPCDKCRGKQCAKYGIQETEKQKV